MSHISKAEFFSHCLGPLFNSTAFDFNGISASFTYKVMVVGTSAQAIDCLTIISPQDIDNLVI
jgi:hypothetical protein